MNKIQSIKNVIVLFAFLLVTWGFWRLLFQVPDPFDELIAKPLLWLLPVYLLLRRENKKWASVGMNTNNLFPGIYIALILGAIFAIEALVINYLKYRGLSFSTTVDNGMLVGAIALSGITAFVEEVTFRGYLFGRLLSGLGNELKANLLSTFAWVAIHMPLVIFDWKLNFSEAFIYALLIGLFGFGSAFLYARTKSIIPSVILHVLWVWPIILFR